MGRWWVLLVALLVGCASAEFYPRTRATESLRPIATYAVRVYDDDLPQLQKAGAVVLGSVAARGDDLADHETLAGKASGVAADHGGTHVLLTNRGVDHVFVTTPGRANTTCGEGLVQKTVECSTTYTPPTTRTHARPTAQFVVLRVDPEKWDALPKPLRPEAIRW